MISPKVSFKGSLKLLAIFFSVCLWFFYASDCLMRSSFWPAPCFNRSDCNLYTFGHLIKLSTLSQSLDIWSQKRFKASIDVCLQNEQHWVYRFFDSKMRIETEGVWRTKWLDDKKMFDSGKPVLVSWSLLSHSFLPSPSLPLSLSLTPSFSLTATLPLSTLTRFYSLVFLIDWDI